MNKNTGIGEVRLFAKGRNALETVRSRIVSSKVCQTSHYSLELSIKSKDNFLRLL